MGHPGLQGHAAAGTSVPETRGDRGAGARPLRFSMGCKLRALPDVLAGRSGRSMETGAFGPAIRPAGTGMPKFSSSLAEPIETIGLSGCGVPILSAAVLSRDRLPLASNRLPGAGRPVAQLEQLLGARGLTGALGAWRAQSARPLQAAAAIPAPLHGKAGAASSRDGPAPARPVSAAGRGAGGGRGRRRARAACSSLPAGWSCRPRVRRSA